MTIQFADPGYNFGLMWLGIGLTLLGIVLFRTPFFIFKTADDIGAWPMPGFLLTLIAPAVFFSWAAGDYSYRVDTEKYEQVISLGFDNVSLSGARFTAATEDGQYFEGVLVDLRPDEGYAYEVLELNRTGD